MILRFSKHDMLNCELLDVHTRRSIYHLETTLSFIRASVDGDNHEKPLNLIKCRKTSIRHPDGETMAEIHWEGSKPAGLSIRGEKFGGVHDLFGQSTVRFEPSVLFIPSRFDSNHVWSATPDSLTIFDHNTGMKKGAFHKGSLRVGKKFVKLHTPKLGHDYLEFDLQDLTDPIEVIVSFLVVEMLRRTRFHLEPYAFRDR